MAGAAPVDLVSELLELPVGSLARVFNAKSSEIFGLHVSERAKLLRSLHLRVITRSSGSAASWRPTAWSSSGDATAILTIIANVLMAARSAELTALKVALDSLDGSLRHDLRGLLASLDQGTQARLRAHIDEQAKAALAEWAEARSASELDASARDTTTKSSQYVWFPIKLYSDYDDTMQVRLFDHSFPNGQIYPGVPAFLRALQGRVPDNITLTATDKYTLPTVDMLLSQSGMQDILRALVSFDEVENEVFLATSDAPLSPPGFIKQKRSMQQIPTGAHITIATETPIDSQAESVAPLVAIPDGDDAEGRDSPRTPLRLTPDHPDTPHDSLTDHGDHDNASMDHAVADHGDVTEGDIEADVARLREPEMDTLRRLTTDVHIMDSQHAEAVSNDNAIFGVAIARDAGITDDALSGVNAVAIGTPTGCPSTPIAPSPAVNVGLVWSPESQPGSVSRRPAAAEVRSDAATDVIIAGQHSAAFKARVYPHSLATTLTESAFSLESGSVASTPISIAAQRPTDGMFSPVAADSPIGHLDVSGLVYISARPTIMKKGTLTNATDLIGVQPQAILCGTILTSLTNKSMAEKKVENFVSYHPYFPEYRAVWLGDSGQGDILVGEMMLKWYEGLLASSSGPHPPRPLVLIHDICHSNQKPYNDAPARDAYRARGIHLFDSYVEAAVIAFEHGALSARGLQFVIHQAGLELQVVRFTSEKQRHCRFLDFQRAVRRAHAALLAAFDAQY